MKTLVVETLTGFTLAFVGFVILYEVFTNVLFQDIISLLAGLILVSAGISVLFRAGRRDKHIPGFVHKHSGSDARDKSILEKNNEMISVYGKTNEMRLKLRMLKRS